MLGVTSSFEVFCPLLIHRPIDILDIRYYVCFRKFDTPRQTANLRVTYYVKHDFSRNFYGSALRKVERDVESLFLQQLQQECYHERIASKSNHIYFKFYICDRISFSIEVSSMSRIPLQRLVRWNVWKDLLYMIWTILLFVPTIVWLRHWIKLLGLVYLIFISV